MDWDAVLEGMDKEDSVRIYAKPKDADDDNPMVYFGRSVGEIENELATRSVQNRLALQEVARLMTMCLLDPSVPLIAQRYAAKALQRMEYVFPEGRDHVVNWLMRVEELYGEGKGEL